MGYSLAAVSSMLGRSDAHRAECLAILRGRASDRIDMDGITIHEPIEQPWPPRLPMTMRMRAQATRLRYSLGYLFIEHPDGERENAYLTERALLLKLLNDSVVDVVDFCVGEPRTKRRVFGIKYEPVTICGNQAFVALEPAARHPDDRQLVLPLTQLVHERWNDLVANARTVAIERCDRAAFLRSCRSLPYLEEWDALLTSSAKRT